MNVFDRLYDAGKSFYGPDLFDYLKGWDEKIMNYNSEYYQLAGICLQTLAICAILWVLYYYVINHPRFNRWWSWLIVLIVNAAIAILIVFIPINKDVIHGVVPDSLHVTIANAIGFALYNGVLSSLIFFVLTMLFRHWSRNCSCSPWKSIRFQHKN